MIELNERILELTKEDFFAAFKLFESEGKEYPASRFYDIFYNGKYYPPKPIIALAYKNRFGEKISTKELNQGKGSLEFKLVDNFGFRLVKKKSIKSDNLILFKEIQEALIIDNIQNLCKEVDFHFEKARVIFKQIKLHNEKNDFYSKLLGEFLNSELNFSDFYKSLNADSKEHEFIQLVAELTAYIDYNSANKKGLNKYPDFRVIARTGVNQSLWLRGFLNFKISNNNPESLPKNTGTVFKYLNNPGSELTMLSPDHRSRVSKYILNHTSYNEDTFVEALINYFKKYSFHVTNPENFTRVISEVLYLFPDVNRLWNPEESTQGKKSRNIIAEFTESVKTINLFFPTFLTKRYIASLATKPFVIFTGLSGSGKTKIAQTFSKWICESDQQNKIIPVGADWTNREPLLGYPNSLDPTKYVLPDNGALDLILGAIEDARGKELKDCKPFFLILDEMNLSHVERYFSDFLSGMESKEAISLYTGNNRKDENGRAIPKEITLPPNLFLVGTVNIDETTYMFSPKVLDRANTIEFRVDKDDIIRFFDGPIDKSDYLIDAKGSSYSSDLMAFVSKQMEQSNTYQKQLLEFFKALQPIGAEFGYRTANEMNRLIALLELLGMEKSESALDVAVMHKLLPKLHGSRAKLNKVLPVLASFCFKSCNTDQAKSFLDEFKQEGKLKNETKPILPLSFTKIARMYVAAQENGFASYAEG
jgi:hypothetical protein